MLIDRVWSQEVTPEADRQPLVAVAIHDGHLVRDDVAKLIALGEAERLREEDPFTGVWTSIAPTRVTGVVSRFQIDLNRPRDKAVYRSPGDAWGLQVWNEVLPHEVADQSIREYDEFYSTMHALLGAMANRFERFVVYDLHSYNHRRGGPDGPHADPDENPQVNIGTGSLDRNMWGPVVDRFITDLRSFDFPGGPLDVRENVKFKGGHFSRWVHENFPTSACVLAIEFKKFFMDEWTGQPDPVLVDAITAALRSTVPGVIESLAQVAPPH